MTIANPELSKELDEYKEAIKIANGSRAFGKPIPETDRLAKVASSSPSANDRRTINVRMLDGENFVTEWDDLAPPLPPPPDHGLRSPIVAALLQQWTPDTAMHESLLSWLERIMNGANPDTVPPLTISSLDHQIRDGFAMHVLPLLLRRPDIHVDVKTRAHRRTSYDMSVAVTRTVPLSEQNMSRAMNKSPYPSTVSSQLTAPSTEKAKKTHMMAYQASHGKHHAEADESVMVDENALTARQLKVSDYLRTNGLGQSSEVGSGSVAHSTTTAHITNSSRRHPGEPNLHVSGHSRSLGSAGSAPSGRIDDRDMNDMHFAVSRAMLGDDISVSSSTTGGSSQQSAQHQQG